MKKILILILLSVRPATSQTFQQIKDDLDSFWTQKFQAKNLEFQKPTVYPVNNEYNFLYRLGTIKISVPLINDLKKKDYTPKLFYFIMSHEYGHAVLDQLNEFPLIAALREYQADCLAGCYLKLTGKQIDYSENYRFLNEFSEVERKVTIKEVFLNGHGTNENRIKAMQLGYNQGSVNTCIKDYSLKLTE